MKFENDTFGLVLRMRSMVYSSKDFESLWFLYQAEGLPKNISIEEFLDEPSGKAERCTKHGVLCKQSDQRSSGLSNFRNMVQEDA